MTTKTMDVFSLRDTRLQTPPSPLAKGRQLPPEPRLQVNGPADLRALRAQEDAQLNSYGWMARQCRASCTRGCDG